MLDVPVFAAIAALAFNGYEAGKTVFVVPLVAAVTVAGVPLLRRLVWLGIAGGLAWLVFSLQAGTTQGALAAVPHDPAGLGLDPFLALSTVAGVLVHEHGAGISTVGGTMSWASGGGSGRARGGGRRRTRSRSAATL